MDYRIREGIANQPSPKLRVPHLVKLPPNHHYQKNWNFMTIARKKSCSLTTKRQWNAPEILKNDTHMKKRPIKYNISGFSPNRRRRDMIASGNNTDAINTHFCLLSDNQEIHLRYRKNRHSRNFCLDYLKNNKIVITAEKRGGNSFEKMGDYRLIFVTVRKMKKSEANRFGILMKKEEDSLIDM